MSPPVAPVHTTSMGGVTATVIKAIEVRMVTSAVPPGSFVQNGTVTAALIIILISGGEGLISMPLKRVASIS